LYFEYDFIINNNNNNNNNNYSSLLAERGHSLLKSSIDKPNDIAVETHTF